MGEDDPGQGTTRLPLRSHRPCPDQHWQMVMECPATAPCSYDKANAVHIPGQNTLPSPLSL
jgi:hypothetical protein